jgi:hypothetical protein
MTTWIQMKLILHYVEHTQVCIHFSWFVKKKNTSHLHNKNWHFFICITHSLKIADDNTAEFIAKFSRFKSVKTSHVWKELKMREPFQFPESL